MGLTFYTDSSVTNLPSSASNQASGAAKQSGGIASGTGISDSVFASELEQACSSESLKTLYGIQRCYNMCQAHLCCFPADAIEAEEDCTDIYEEKCDAYQPCEQLVSLHPIWNPPTSTDEYAVKIAVNDACIPPQHNIPVTPQWVTNCHRVCESRLCCLVEESMVSSCVDAFSDGECDQYEACKVLIGRVSKESDSIDSVCTSKVSDDVSLFSACKARCEARPCCFATSAAYSCYEMVSTVYV